MPIPKTVKPKTPCKTCHNCHSYCGLSGKDIAEKATEEFEDDEAFCVDHAKRPPDGPQKPG